MKRYRVYYRVQIAGHYYELFTWVRAKSRPKATQLAKQKLRKRGRPTYDHRAV